MKNYVIGALHFSPMVGYEGHESYGEILKKAKSKKIKVVTFGKDKITYYIK